ncbi:MAG: outer membrane lipid asymmetry maintenance protein MlaD [Desulfobacterium sp.]|nr:outer membrane lipid asymmetry maintenance protein MlaD [Desulfobacterium sp.]MBU3949055.1 outer membrane lipid asymmetry maintenance protein MlaD [Pseudomonadota bacterium]MBU4010610.1 outer membrane lipid asymmetry maintenance protein MlaD [Pseudomonadota bacterium]MBU4035282.1 outer membrane lipid asymmetry maintenance protein MlaD [Pseudomonadota bacterium]
MKKQSIETSVGIFFLIGLICVGYLTIKLGKMEFISDNSYVVKAKFKSVSGLKPGSQVEMAGVKIGSIDSVSLDKDDRALVNIKINKGIVLTDDVIASIKTSGLIGDRYISISPGGSEIILKSGDTITETESAIDIEELISKYVFGKV